MSNNLFLGFHYFIKGFRYLNKPGLKRYVYIPLLINGLIFSVGIGISIHYFQHFVTGFNHRLPQWLQWLDWLLWPLFAITAMIVITYTFVMIANILAAPFNSLLSEKVESLWNTRIPQAPKPFWDELKDIPKSIKRQRDIIKYFIPRFILLIVLFIIPGLNIITAPLWFLFGCWVMALQYVDYPMDNHHISFIEMRKRLKISPLQYLVFGFAVTIVMLIPIVNFFAMPAAVIGATLMVNAENQLG